MLFIKHIIDKICGALGVFCALLMLLMLANVFYNVVARYAFNNVSIGLQELEWHLFSALFLVGTAYAIHSQSHVRVDIIYDRLHQKTQAWINILGILLLLIPFCVLVVYYGIDFVAQAIEYKEKSGDPGGLPHRWIIKAFIPIGFSLMILASIGQLINAILILQNKTHLLPQQPTQEDKLL